MYIGYDEQQEALRQELRDYYAELLTPEIKDQLAAEEGCGPVHREIVGQMGRDGYLTVGWPEEYGGRGARRRAEARQRLEEKKAAKEEGKAGSYSFSQL